KKHGEYQLVTGDFSVEDGFLTEPVAGREEVDLGGALVLFGISDGLVHAEAGVSAITGEDTLLSYAIDKRPPVFAEQTVENSYRKVVQTLINSGITSVSLLGKNPHIAKKVLSDSGLRAVFYYEVEDASQSTQGAMDALEQAVTLSEQGFCVLPFAQSAFTCSEQLLTLLADYCYIHRLPFAARASQTLTEAGQCEVKTGLSPVMCLHKLGCFDYGGCIVGGNVTDKDDLDLMAQAGVSLVVTPRSSAAFGRPHSPICTAISRGVRVCLASGFLAHGYPYGLWREASFALLNGRSEMGRDALSFSDILSAMSLDFTFRIGAPADFSAYRVQVDSLEELPFAVDDAACFCTVVNGIKIL
ncbi:MAG: hypothetical protein IJF71_04310, partial [Clostridia bacterium]|nr:hypothetical protein [Clostridia bacterium]